MRAPALFVAVSLAGLLAACSRPAPPADDDLARDLDLALGKSTGGVASQLEVNGVRKPKTRAPAAPQKSHTAMAMAHMSPAPQTETAAVPEPAGAVLLFVAASVVGASRRRQRLSA